MTNVRKLYSKDYFFLLYLLILVTAYAVHFLSFTLFDGFTTFSNDAGSYVLLARKWSPFFPPSDAVLYTWPSQILPPGLPWTLAITGASRSLWTGHLLVSLCMLSSIFLVGWMAYRRLGWLIGGLLALGLCLLPGVITSSMGILSENLYLLLSLTVLLLYSAIRKSEETSWTKYLLLLFLLTLVILTRTIGIALIAAIFLVTLINKGLSGKQKISLFFVTFSSLALWLFWGFMNPQASDLTYGYYFEHYIGTDATMYDILVFLWHSFSTNFIQILSSWNHYLSLSHSNIWFFLFSYTLFLPCLIGLSLRFFQGKLDSVYLTFYIAILLIWPHPDQITRFLHPIVFLLVLQPVLYFGCNAKARNHFLAKTMLVSIILVLIASSIIIQIHLLKQKEVVVNTNPDLAQSFEFYNSPSREFGLTRASAFADIMRYMATSAQHVPAGGVVATVKHVTYSILTNRRAVNLVTTVPLLQQLCNLKIKDVDVVFLSALTTKFNLEGNTHLEKYRDLSSDVWMVTGDEGESLAYSLVINKTKLDSKLVKEGYNCQSYQDHL